MSRRDRVELERASAELPFEEARFVEALRRSYAPPSESTADRAAFEAALRRRIEAEAAPRRRWASALAGAAAALALVCLGQAWFGPPSASESALRISESGGPGDVAPGLAARPASAWSATRVASGNGRETEPAADGPGLHPPGAAGSGDETGPPLPADELAWEEGLFFPTAHLEGEAAEGLPDEYRLLAMAFFGEVR